jgi:hypothetical protein
MGDLEAGGCRQRRKEHWHHRNLNGELMMKTFLSIGSGRHLREAQTTVLPSSAR